MMYIFPFFFFLGPCIPAGHFVFTWIVQTLVIVYTGSVYGYVFMAMDICLDVDSRVCMDVWLCFWMYGCVYGYGYVFVAMCLWLCAWVCVWVCVWIPGLDPPRGLVQ
jgi:hypothetical protein